MGNLIYDIFFIQDIKIKSIELKQNKNYKEYKIINIQNLDKKPQPIATQQNDFPLWKYERIYHIDNVEDKDSVLYFPNNFLGAFISAYNNHGDLILSPDDIWIQIALYMSKYININSEKLRNKFVLHQGNKKLTIIEYSDYENNKANNSKNNNENDTYENYTTKWNKYFQQIINQINDNLQNNLVEEFSCDFSTTEKIHQILSISIIMNSCKNYFSYGRMILGCGINNIHFMGTYDDWYSLTLKIQKFKKYDVDNILIKYIDHMSIILDEFLNTYINKVNLQFWNTILATEEKRIGSGTQIQTNVSGWILHFFGIYNKISLDDIPNYDITVPIELIDIRNNTKKNLELKNDWCCVSQIDNYIYKPNISIDIYEIDNQNSISDMV